MYEMHVQLKSDSPYRQRRKHRVAKLPREKDDDYEARTWIYTVLYNSESYWQMPPAQFKAALMQAARYLKMRIPGKGTTTYLQPFTAGVACLVAPSLPYTRETLPGEWESVASDGRRGGGKRVDRCFATCEQWQGVTEWLVYDDLISEEVFLSHLRAAGLLVGVGCWRPQTGGSHGRFSVTDWHKSDLSL